MEVDEQAVSVAVSAGKAEPQTLRLDREQIAEARLVVKI
jgi:hypothetical protein